MTHHAAGLRRLTGNEALATALADDYTTAPLDAAERGMLDYAAQLTRAPATIAQSDIDALAGHGFPPAAILDLCQVTAYFAFVNRLADGLGVELESPADRGR